MSIIKLENVWKIYQIGKVKVEALRGVNLEIKKNEFVAIMGPSGSGKCVSGNTLVYDKEGIPTPIKEFYGKRCNKVISFNNNKISPNSVSKHYKRKVKEIFEITTTSGKTIEVTKEHPFFCISKTGYSEIRAKDLKQDCFIAMPRKINFKGKNQKLNSLNHISSDKNIIISESKQIVKEIFSDIGVNRSEIYKRLSIPLITFDSWLYHTNIPVYRLNQILSIHNRKISEFEKKIKYIKKKNSPRKNKIKLPLFTNKKLMEIYGYLAGDGGIDKYGVKISNVDDKLKDYIKKLFKNVFDIEAKNYINTRIDFSNTALSSYFKHVFAFPEKKKSNNIKIPDFIFKCTNNEIAAFIRGLFDCDSHVDKNKSEINITLASKQLINDLECLFLRFGIFTRKRKVLKRATNSSMKNKEYYSLSISGFSNLKIYNKYIGFNIKSKKNRLKCKLQKIKKRSTNVDVIPAADLMRNIRKSLNYSLKRIKKECRIDFWQVEGTKRNPQKKTLKIFYKVLIKRLNHIKKIKKNLDSIKSSILPSISKDVGYPLRRNYFKNNWEGYLLNIELKKDKIKKEIKDYLNNMILLSENLINKLHYIISISENLFWDKIKLIKILKKEERVYDLTVPSANNFIANNFLVHNSTCVNMVGCLDIPTKGHILLENQDISKLSESNLAQIRGRKIGFIFQQFNLINTLNALENVMLPMTFQNIDREKRIQRAKKLLEMVDLGDRIEHKPTEMSGGEQQRVAIARSLSNDPEVVLADEPTGNLDTETGNIVMNFLKKLHKTKKKTIIMVTHDGYVAKRADRTEYLLDGRIIKRKR